MTTTPATFSTSMSDVTVADFRDLLGSVACFGGCDLVLTSPPYDDARTYGNAVSWTFADYQALGDAIFGALKPGGHALVVLDGPVREWREGKGTERSFTPWRTMLDWAERVGFRVPDRLAYGRMGMPGRYEGRFRNDWEPILWFQRPGADGFFDKDPLSESAAYGTKKRQAAKGRRSDGTMYSRTASGEAVERGLKRRGTLWDYHTVGSGHDEPDAFVADHPARFCVRLAEDAVRCFCPPGGLVVDPFVGSGTSAAAAVRHGRMFVGGDLFADAAGKPWAEWAHERAVSEMARLAAAPAAPAAPVGGAG